MADGFCEACTAESSDESSGDVGGRFISKGFWGEDRNCATCGSHVAVLFREFIGLPLQPLGCYRYKMVGAEMTGIRFLTRKVPDDAALVRKARLRGLAFAITVFAAIAAYEYYRRHR